jgi:hypothetical protein
MSREESIKLTVKSLLEVVQTGAKNIEITVMESYGKVTVGILPPKHIFSATQSIFYWQNLTLTEIEGIVADIEREKEAGQYYNTTPRVAYANKISFLCRGGEEALSLGGDGCWPSCDDSKSGGLIGRFWKLLYLFCNQTTCLNATVMIRIT